MKGARSVYGFTIVEMLTVVVIVALLAALLFSVYGRAKATAQRSPCIAHLRQYGMALQMYEASYESLDPPFPSTDELVASGLFDAKLALCPLDPVGGYASRFESCRDPRSVVPTSYETLSRFDRDSTFLNKLMEADKNHGVAACRLHGHRTDFYARGLRDFCLWAWQMYEGPLLRLRKDGSVQTAQLTLDTPSDVPNAGRRFSLWSLFTDEPEPDWSSLNAR